MKKFILFSIFTCHLPFLAYSKEVVSSIGLFEKEGKSYHTVLSLLKLDASQKPFPVTFDQAEVLVQKHLKNHKEFGSNLRITSMTLLSFEQGRIMQVLVNSSPLKFSGGSAGTTIYYYITSSMELIYPEVKE